MEKLPDDIKNQIKNFIIFKPRNNEELQEAVDFWCACKEGAIKPIVKLI